MSEAPAGYDFTPKEHSLLLEQFVDCLNLKDLTLIVQDWGGPIGLGFSGRRPELVRRLIIGNSFAWPLNGVRRVEIFSWVMGGPIGRSLTQMFNFVPWFFFTRGFARKADPEVLALYLAPWRKRERRVAAFVAPRQLIAAAPYLREVEANLPKLAGRPALIVWGTKDFAFRDAERQRFEKTFPAHKTALLQNASHFLKEDAGEEIAGLIRQFMRPEEQGDGRN
jgi:haloalkane dehalogenase